MTSIEMPPTSGAPPGPGCSITNFSVVHQCVVPSIARPVTVASSGWPVSSTCRSLAWNPAAVSGGHSSRSVLPITSSSGLPNCAAQASLP